MPMFNRDDRPRPPRDDMPKPPVSRTQRGRTKDQDSQARREAMDPRSVGGRRPQRPAPRPMPPGLEGQQFLMPRPMPFMPGSGQGQPMPMPFMPGSGQAEPMPMPFRTDPVAEAVLRAYMERMQGGQ